MAVIKINSQVTITKDERQLNNYVWKGSESNKAGFAKVYTEDLDTLKVLSSTGSNKFGGTIRLIAELVHSTLKDDQGNSLKYTCPLVIAVGSSNPDNIIFWEEEDYAIPVCPPNDRDSNMSSRVASVDEVVEQIHL